MADTPKMLGRDVVGRRVEAIATYTKSGVLGLPTIQADGIITAYLAHMESIGWKMMPNEMTDKMRHEAERHCGNVLGPKVGTIWRAAYDHAPELTEDE